MRARPSRRAVLVFVSTLVAGTSLHAQVTDTSTAQGHVHPAGQAERLGTVHLATSCRAEAQRRLNRAVSLLHSFEFGPAIAAFSEAHEVDPSCAMAQWGVALSRWSNPFAVGTRSTQQIQQGLGAVERARAIGAKTERERGIL